MIETREKRSKRSKRYKVWWKYIITNFWAILHKKKPFIGQVSGGNNVWWFSIYKKRIRFYDSLYQYYDFIAQSTDASQSFTSSTHKTTVHPQKQWPVRKSTSLSSSQQQAIPLTYITSCKSSPWFTLMATNHDTD